MSAVVFTIGHHAANVVRDWAPGVSIIVASFARDSASIIISGVTTIVDSPDAFPSTGNGKIMLGVVNKIIGKQFPEQAEFVDFVKNVNDADNFKKLFKDALPNPFLSADDKVLKTPDWSRLELWDGLRARWLGATQPDPVDRSGRGFSHG